MRAKTLHSVGVICTQASLEVINYPPQYKDDLEQMNLLITPTATLVNNCHLPPPAILTTITNKELLLVVGDGEEDGE